jgi:hypothetical protein
MSTCLTCLANGRFCQRISCVALRTYFAHFNVFILNELKNNLIFALDVHSPFAGPMILYICDSSRVVTIELHGVYNAMNNIKLIDELPTPILLASQAAIYSASTVESAVLSRLELF